MPEFSGSIPSHVFYGSIMSEVLRIARASLQYCDFIPKVQTLFKRMINQGACEVGLSRQVSKVLNKHPDAFKSFNLQSNIIKADLKNS